MKRDGTSRQGRQIVFATGAVGQSLLENRGAFTRLVKLAAGHGGTHLMVGNIPFKYGSWVLPDNTDPYAAWCNHCPSLLRICPPKALQPWVSVEHARELQQYLRWQLDEMKPYGLKGITFAVEPLWLPEEVYRAHPNWRGTQCELGRIALRPYFAPNIDDEEVLELYRLATQEYATLFPEVDQYQFLSNDSGGGLPWTPNVYPGMNGPVANRRKDGGARVAKWLKALQEGSAKGGVPGMRYNLGSSGLPPELVASAQLQCDKGLFVNGGNRQGETFGGPGAGYGGGLWTVTYPAIGVESVAAFVEGLQNVYAPSAAIAPDAKAGINLYDQTLDWAEKIMAIVLKDPGTGSVDCAHNLLAVAEWFCGSQAKAETLIKAWRSIDLATHAVGQVRQKGFSIPLVAALVIARWLTRPLVPQPELLTAEELKHVTPRVFSVNLEKELKSFHYILGKAVFTGSSAMWMARWALQEAFDTLNGAAETVRSIGADAATPAEAKPRLALLADRVAAYACLAAS
ncbi:MAG: hypothetical protein FWF84_05225, partial [Kiritimatiellaeota bacterium]|nr:hypothetical protein [Kiritimatiellota bacterium]